MPGSAPSASSSPPPRSLPRQHDLDVHPGFHLDGGHTPDAICVDIERGHRPVEPAGELEEDRRNEEPVLRMDGKVERAAGMPVRVDRVVAKGRRAVLRNADETEVGRERDESPSCLVVDREECPLVFPFLQARAGTGPASAKGSPVSIQNEEESEDYHGAPAHHFSRFATGTCRSPSGQLPRQISVLRQPPGQGATVRRPRPGSHARVSLAVSAQ